MRLKLLFYILLASAIGQKIRAQEKIPLIKPEAIEATMRYLADDSLEGRQPGTRGFEIASKYIQEQFLSIGLEPGVNKKDYKQPVPLQKGLVNSKASKFTLIDSDKTEEWSYATHFILSPYLIRDQSEIAAPLVFAGFGVFAPELGYDDYKGLDVNGKIIVIMDQAPETFGNNERAYFSNSTVKYQEAAKRGAIGVIMLTMSKRTSWEATVRRSAQGSFKWLNEKNLPSNTFESLKAIANVNPLHHDKLFIRSGMELDKVYNNVKSGKAQSFPLNISAHIKVITQRSFVESSNLIGIIPGSDPKLKNEYVVYAAHLDHFGIGAPMKGDSIYNGAHDNASGVAIVMEIARTFRALSVPPKRSVVIAIVTGEEYGLLGSDYFVNNPTVSGTIVANLTLDMPFFFHPVLDIVPYGAQHSNLNKHVIKTAELLNLKISPDPFPEQVVFIRSDHFSFVKKGIPSLFIKSGFMTTPTDTVNRAKSDVAWRSTTYHTPKDDMSQKFDFNAAATHVQVNYLIGLFIANDMSQPHWNKGDFFGTRFQKNTSE